MGQMRIARQMMEFNKTMFDSNFKSLAILQDQSEKLFYHYMGKATWIPDEGKKTINDLVNAYKTAIEAFKTYTDENYKKINDYFVKTQT